METTRNLTNFEESIRELRTKYTPNSTDSTGEFIGNTTINSPAPKSTKVSKVKSTQESAKVKWVFTWHNYSEKDIEKLNYMAGIQYSTANRVKTFKFLIFAKEVGGAGETPHLQGYCEMVKRQRLTAMKEIFGNNTIHFEPARGTRQANVEYIEKEGGDIFVNGKKVGKLNILKRNQLYKWELFIEKIIMQEPDERKIYWLYETIGGSGKSTFVRYLVAEHGALTLSNKAADMKYGIINYKEKMGVYPQLIVIDIPRSIDGKFISYTGIEEIKNGCFFSTKYESSQVLMPQPHIIVFANIQPNFEQMSRDRWEVRHIDTNQDVSNPVEPPNASNFRFSREGAIVDDDEY